MEKKYYVYKAEQASYMPYVPGRLPDPSDWVDAQVVGPFTENELHEHDWLERQSVAEAAGEPDWEECGDCLGDGCDSCDDEGGHSGDWSEYVDRVADSSYEEYDPKLHYMARSDRPEHLQWKRTTEIANKRREIEMAERDVEQALKEVRRQEKLARASEARKLSLELELKVLMENDHD